MKGSLTMTLPLPPGRVYGGRVLSRGTSGHRRERTRHDDNCPRRGAAHWRREGRDRGQDPPYRPLVVPAGDPGRGADALGRLRDVPGVHAGPLLDRPVPLPDAVLLAVRLERVHAGGGGVRAVPAGVADPAVRGDDAAVPAAVPPDLLLLPQGVLPGVLDVAAGLRRRRAALVVQRRDPLPADRPERAPLL